MRAGIFGSAHHEAGGGGVTATFQQTGIDPADINPYTFSAQPIGSASATRRVVVGIGTNSTRTVTAVTIGGVPATIDETNTLSGTAHVAIASAVVPTGTTADIVVTLDNNGIGMGIGVWTLNDGAPTGQTGTGNGDPTDLTVSGTTPGSAVLAFAFTTGVATATFNWTGATGRFVEDVYSTTTTIAGADTTAAGASTVISLDPSSSQTVGVAVEYA